MDSAIFAADLETLKTEINKLLVKGVVVACDHVILEEFISSTFVREKTNDPKRLILSLETLNKNLMYKHFKPENLQSIIALV